MLHRLLRQWESPPTWLLLFVGLAWVQSRLLPLIDLGRFGDFTGIALVGAGIVVLTFAAWHFRQHRTTILPREVPQTMITGGIYAYSRNPIYAADAIILAGFTLFWDAASLLLVPAFMWVIWRRFIRGEEAGLRRLFGAEFDNWARRTGRWYGPL